MVISPSSFEANKSLTDVIKQLDELNKKLALITRETEVAQKIRDEFKELGQNLLSLHCSYLDAMNNIAFKMRLQYEDVRLTSAIVLKPNFSQALSECISLRSVAMNELIDNVVKGFNKQNKTENPDDAYAEFKKQLLETYEDIKISEDNLK